MTLVISHDERQCPFRSPLDLHINRPPEFRLVAFEALSQSSLENWIARLPQPVAWMNARKVHVATSERNRNGPSNHVAVSSRSVIVGTTLGFRVTGIPGSSDDLVHPAAFFGLLRP